ncbi:hypothetical protein Sme01_30490 [Sphaerisporangium melleum]|uniref:Gas vesicle structural protein n=1 Tax=Sphaerisporangium melleum TaxID=321316 RepID=A0A917RP24_9ACTN|nr:hypothetical protein GCM10007964_67760 [Sphaerisporangium melleum]GII70573.1 hypothetical protein Sme01_30490 [Sphaerisporangium melleum]
MSDPTRPARVSSPFAAPQRAPARDSGGNLGDILERVLDRGVVIVGDIRVNLLDIELLTIKLRLLIASVDTARELGIDWWEHDPWLSSKDRDLVEENRRLRRRLAAVDEREELQDERAAAARALPDDRPRRRHRDEWAMDERYEREERRPSRADPGQEEEPGREPAPRRTGRPPRAPAPGREAGPARRRDRWEDADD